MVTLNSPGGVLPRWFSPFVNKSPVSNLFSAAFNLVNDLFVLPFLEVFVVGCGFGSFLTPHFTVRFN